MKRLTNKSGFTLIEIIVVLIIVGILAAIALPNLFSNVSKSRAEEALATIGTYRPTIEACESGNPTTAVTNCTAAKLGNPTSSTNFSYALTAPASTYDYSIKASGQGALTTADTITIARTNAQVISCVGAGALLGAC